MATPAEEEGLTAVDLREEGVLASLLDSIRLAGSNLNSILDDVLDFGAASGLRSNPRGPSARVEDVDLSRLVEEVALEELEHLKMTVRQKERLGVSPNAIPKLLIDVSPAVAEQRWRVDRSGMRKVLSKILSNALRFTREGFVEVVVRHSVKGPPGPGQHDTTMLDFVIVDTGTGMTQGVHLLAFISGQHRASLHLTDDRPFLLVPDFIDNHLTAPFAKGDSFQSGTGLSMTLVAVSQGG